MLSIAGVPAAPQTLPLSLRGEPVRIGLTWKNDDAEPGVAIVTAVVPGSPAARAGIEPLDRLSLPLPRGEDTDWLRELNSAEGVITLRRERRGQIREVSLQPLPVPGSPSSEDKRSSAP
jgi:S1-C subfamily serine protease